MSFFKRRRGFTLIELLIVVAIIAILAAIAIPNFLMAQVRAKVARNQAQMATIATAVESYYVDYNTYPPSANDMLVLGWDMTVVVFTAYEALRRCTTPVAYVTSIPYDLFNYTGIPFPAYGSYVWVTRLTEPFNYPLVEDRVKSGGWSVCSVGPNRTYDYWYFSTPPTRDYDPSNGTISNGDMVRTGP